MRYVVVTSMLLLAGGVLTLRAQPTRPPAQRASAPTTNPAAAPVDPVIAAFMKPVEAAEGDTEMRRKLAERHNIAVRLLEFRVKDYRRGITPLSPVFEAARTVADAKLDLAGNDEERAKTVQQVVDVSKVIEQTLEKQVRSGFGSEADLERARLARVTAEVELLKLKEPGQPARPADNNK
jgi:hypothetical protein